MKIKIKCDKDYGGEIGWVDGDCFDDKILQEVVDGFSYNEIIEVTEIIVDFYNERRSKNNKKSYKTANIIVTQLRKFVKSIRFQTK